MTFVRNKKRENEVSIIEWHIAIYVRLSKEDGDKEESDSIQNQTRIIENHIKNMKSQGEVIASVQIYADDGYPGGNFDRPAYKQMIEDIETGKINCVIFKDNSRLGRNYPELGRLMEEYFPQKGIRVISVLNYIDSLKDPHGYCSAIVSFSNIMNDDYIRQLSVKIKCTFAMKRERGEFLGNYAPYGYMKSPENKHKLVIDPEAAEIVRMIFNWYADGTSVNGVVKQLNALQIMPPSVYKTMNGCKGFTQHSSGGIKRNVWSITSVNSILKDEVYIGNLVQGKFKSASYRSKKMVQVDESEWTVVEGTHEPIITDEIFTIVHDRFARHTRVGPKSQTSYLLSGFVKCATCGSRMNRQTSNGNARYRCTTRLIAPDKCQCPSVKESLLEHTVLKAVQEQIQELVDAKAVIDAVRESAPTGRSQNEYLLALSKAEQEKKRLAEAKFRLYDNFERGILDQEEYMLFKGRYATEIAEQDQQIEKLQQDLITIKEARKQDDEFIAFFKKYGNIETLDRDTLNHLLDHIEVTNSKHIGVFFKFSSERQKILDFARNIEEANQERKNVC